jgi:hypothetical protein
MAMRPATVRVTAAGFSNWIPLTWLVPGFVVGFGVKLSSNANLTYTVQHTFDNILTPFAPLSPITRSTTVATVPITNHGLSVADWIHVQGAGAPLDGDFAVASVPNQNSVTYTVANSGAAFSAPGVMVATARIFPHSILFNQTASADGNYFAPPFATRLNVSAFTAGYADLTVINAGANM